jgi:hypothetical protein
LADFARLLPLFGILVTHPVNHFPAKWLPKGYWRWHRPRNNAYFNAKAAFRGLG